MKNIKFDRYAKRRMKWRSISDEEATSVLLSPDYKELTNNGRFNAFKNIGGRTIKVTYSESDDEIYVITAVIK